MAIMPFIDPEAAILFVAEKDLVEQAKQQDAIAFDAPKSKALSSTIAGYDAKLKLLLKTMGYRIPRFRNWR